MNKTDNIYIGFDFSMNKPAATIYYNGHFYFYFWALKLDKKKLAMYSECGVHAVSRELPPITAKGTAENTQLVLVHTIRSTELANIIIKDIDEFINNNFGLTDYNLYVCSEGLSYASKGDATLNLATYKGVLLSKIYEHYDNLKRLFTYSPNTLKSTAGCATKEKRKDKLNMINAFADEPLNNPFRTAVADGSLVTKTNYIEGVDDLVDSYWALKTMIKKENLPL